MQRVGTVLLTGLAGVLVAGAQTADPPVAYRRTAPLAGFAGAAVAWLQHANPFDSKKKKHGGNLYQQVSSRLVWSGRR